MCQTTQKYVSSYSYDLFDFSVLYSKLQGTLSLFRRLTKHLPFCCRYCGKRLRYLPANGGFFNFTIKNGWAFIKSSDRFRYDPPFGNGCPNGHCGTISYRLRTVFDERPYQISYDNVERKCTNKRISE